MAFWRAPDTAEQRKNLTQSRPVDDDTVVADDEPIYAFPRLTGLWRKHRDRMDHRTAGDKVQTGVFLWAVILGAGMLGASALFAWSAPGSVQTRIGVGVTAASLLVASAAIGAIVGFVFGLPRPGVVEQANVSARGKPGRSDATFYLANSNLLKVSDWLTTILIGLGLVQLGRVVPAVTAMADALEAPLGGTPHSGPFGVAAMIGAFAGAILLCYLWTCVRVRELLEEAQHELADSEFLPKAGLHAGQVNGRRSHAIRTTEQHQQADDSVRTETGLNV